MKNPEFGGLVLKLRAGFKVFIGDDIEITVEKSSNYELKLRILAPDEFDIKWKNPSVRSKPKLD